MNSTTLPRRVYRALRRTADDAVRAVHTFCYGRAGIPRTFLGQPFRFAVGHAPRFSGTLQSVAFTRELEWVRSNLKSGDTVIDVGAHVGIFTMAASRVVGPSGRVIAIEPTPESAAILLQHVRLNQLSNVTVVTAAMADGDSLVSFYLTPGDSSQNGFQNFFEGSTRIVVPATTLDSLCELLDATPAVVKLDIEGAEYLALRGMEKVLASGARILCEMHPYAWPRYGITENDIVTWIEQHHRRVVPLERTERMNLLHPYPTELKTREQAA